MSSAILLQSALNMLSPQSVTGFGWWKTKTIRKQWRKKETKESPMGAHAFGRNSGKNRNDDQKILLQKKEVANDR